MDSGYSELRHNIGRSLAAISQQVSAGFDVDPLQLDQAKHSTLLQAASDWLPSLVSSGIALSCPIIGLLAGAALPAAVKWGLAHQSSDTTEKKLLTLGLWQGLFSSAAFMGIAQVSLPWQLMLTAGMGTWFGTERANLLQEHGLQRASSILFSALACVTGSLIGRRSPRGAPLAPLQQGLLSMGAGGGFGLAEYMVRGREDSLVCAAMMGTGSVLSSATHHYIGSRAQAVHHSSPLLSHIAGAATVAMLVGAAPKIHDGPPPIVAAAVLPILTRRRQYGKIGLAETTLGPTAIYPRKDSLSYLFPGCGQPIVCARLILPNGDPVYLAPSVQSGALTLIHTHYPFSQPAQKLILDQAVPVTLFMSGDSTVRYTRLETMGDRSWREAVGIVCSRRTGYTLSYDPRSKRMSVSAINGDLLFAELLEGDLSAVEEVTSCLTKGANGLRSVTIADSALDIVKGRRPENRQIINWLERIRPFGAPQTDHVNILLQTLENQAFRAVCLRLMHHDDTHALVNHDTGHFIVQCRRGQILRYLIYDCRRTFSEEPEPVQDLLVAYSLMWGDPQQWVKLSTISLGFVDEEPIHVKPGQFLAEVGTDDTELLTHPEVRKLTE